MKELETKEIFNLLTEAKTIAVVGISRNKDKTSRIIASFLADKNYRVVGVNPAAPAIPGIPVYKSLADVPHKIDIVDVFRKSEDIGELIPDVIKVNPKCLWLQLGIRNDDESAKAFKAGISIVQDSCILVMYKKLIASA